MVISDISHIPSNEAQQLRFQLATEAAETEVREERVALLRLALETERAELDARKAMAEEIMAQSHQRVVDLQRPFPAVPDRHPSSTRSSPRSPGARSPSPTIEVATLLQMFQAQQQQAADQRRADERHREAQEERREAQRREDEYRREAQEQRREDQRREDRQEAFAREARLEARLTSAFQVAPQTYPGSSTTGFKSNKSFDTLPIFSGDAGQSFRSWQDEFMSKASIVGLQHDNLRELRLKLAGSARAHHYCKYPDTTEPEILEALAHLASEFGAKYAEAKLWAGVYQFHRKPGSPGKDVTRALAANRQRMLAAGIPAVRSAAEDQYYTLELCLTTLQLPIFLTQLSSREDLSDTHLQSLLGAATGNRRDSLMPALTSSDERTRLFEARLVLLVAFLDHDPGEPGHGGQARAAATSGLPADPTPAATLPSLPAPSAADRKAVVLTLKAQHTKRGQDTDKPPPRYYGTVEDPDGTRNAATFAERRALRACYGCTPAQFAAQGAIPHWECRHHGQDASDAERAIRVSGSGPQALNRRSHH